MKAHNYAQSLINAVKAESIHYASSDVRILSSTGKHQNWLIDLRPLLLDAENLQELCDYFWEKFKDRLPF